MTTDDAPVRATWSTQAPAGPWCPPEWLEHLRAAAPGFVAPDGTSEQDEVMSCAAPDDAWQLIAVARRGRLHAHRGEHREDAAAVRAFTGGWCAAVADGAGSAEYSRIGAAIAAHVATEACRAALARPAHTGVQLEAVLASAAARVHETMHDFAANADVPLRALRTTLLLTICHAGTLAFAHVGDGGIALLHANGEASIPTAGHAGEFSGEVTHFLPDDGALAALQSSIQLRDAGDVAGVLLVTDGVEDPWYPLARTAPALFGQLVHGVSDANANAAGVTQPLRGAVLSAPSPSDGMSAWLSFEKRGENDDRTLFVAVQRSLPWPSSR